MPHANVLHLQPHQGLLDFKNESINFAFNFWIVADNLRIGAALNAVRIAEIVVRESLLMSHHS